MTQRSADSTASSVGERTAARQPGLRDRAATQKLQLFAVRLGVAASRTRRIQGNAHAQYWALLVTREQFDAFLASDPLRFEDPFRFAQLSKEFAHAFDNHESRDAA